jgi:hypothetical protein
MFWKYSRNNARNEHLMPERHSYTVCTVYWPHVWWPIRAQAFFADFLQFHFANAKRLENKPDLKLHAHNHIH